MILRPRKSADLTDAEAAKLDRTLTRLKSEPQTIGETFLLLRLNCRKQGVFHSKPWPPRRDRVIRLRASIHYRNFLSDTPVHSCGQELPGCCGWLFCPSECCFEIA